MADTRFKDKLEDITRRAPKSLKMAIRQYAVKGASNWVTARPLHAHESVLHKGDFRDSIFLRYGWEPRNLPEKCGCDERFDVKHAMECMKGGYRGLLHNEVNYVFYEAAKEAGFKDVVWEPELQPLEGENMKYKSAKKEDHARSDLRVLGFWGRKRRAFFDVTAFAPCARSHANSSLKQLFRKEEKRKNREYGERIRNVEHGDFSPLVFSTTGGMGPQASMVVKHLASCLAAKKDLPFSVVAGWLRCRISFALLRSTLLCLRGSRGERSYRPKEAKEDVVSWQLVRLVLR